MTTEPTTEQYEQYDRMLAANVDEDIAAYLTGLSECGCFLPEHSCQMCRGAAKMRNAASDLAMILEMSATVKVTVIDRLMVVDAPPDNIGVVIDDLGAGVQALVDSGQYREYSQHIGGRTTPCFVAEPIEGAATGPVFTRMHPETWKAVER